MINYFKFADNKKENVAFTLNEYSNFLYARKRDPERDRLLQETNPLVEALVVNEIDLLLMIT